MDAPDLKRLLSHDRSDMTGKVRGFPAHLMQGWEIGGLEKIDWSAQAFRHIVYGGMGGSAIAGDLVRTLFAERLEVPFVVKRGYDLPPFSGPDTLFIASSYSGNTEETLSCVEQAVKKGCRMVCLASGGKLMQIARHHQFPLFVLPKGFPPRAALGFSLGVLLRMFVRMGIGTFGEPEVKEAVRRLEQLGDAWSRPAKSDDGPFGVAQGLTGKIPLIYADAHVLEPVGIRWKTQLNENSKTHAFFTPMPEMNHNEINGWEPVAGTKTFYKSLMAVLLRTPEEHPRVALRMDITQRLILKNEGSCIPVHAEGKDFLNRLLYLVAFGDWVSLYLALLYGTDPTEIVNIDHLKKKLSL